MRHLPTPVMSTLPVFFATLILVVNTFKCPRRDGYFPAGSGQNCGKYYKCTKGIPSFHSCGPEEGFHPLWKQCTWEGFVDGCSTASQGKRCGIVDTASDENPLKLAPWMVAIFQRDETGQGWLYAGPGAIVSPTTVVSTCRLGKMIREKFRFNMNANSFQVVAGMETVELSIQEDSRQILSVASVQMNPQSSANSYSFCNAVIHLKGRINLKTPFAKAVCLPIFDGAPKARKAFGYSGVGKIAGYIEKPEYSDGSSHLTSIDFRLTSQPFCFAHTFQKFSYCGASSSGDSDSGLVNICMSHQTISTYRATHDKRWYLLGRGSNFNNEVCEIKGLENDVRIPWIVSSIRCGPSKFPCRDGKCIDLSRICNGEQDCAKGEDEEPKTCRAMNPCIFQDTFECGVYENCINSNKVCDGYPDCFDASDEDSKMCEHSHRKNVPFYKAPELSEQSFTESTLASSETTETQLADTVAPTTSEGLSTQSEYPHPKTCPELGQPEGTVVNCSEPGVPESKTCPKFPTVGTVATYKCAAFYMGAVSAEDSLIKKCGADFRWRPERNLVCVSDCGRLSNSNAYIVNGKRAGSKDRFPWHAAVFIKTKNKDSYICGGTLIRRNFVLTAAHCVTDADGHNSNKPDIFSVALAPSTSSYKSLIAHPKSQVVGVRKIVVNPHFDPSNNYQSDIAILALKKNVEMNENVLPACLPSSDLRDPMPGAVGLISGFGVDETGKLSDVLRFANLPVVATEDCREVVGFLPSVNQICAGYSNGTGVCFGDSGGGLVFLQNDRYYLQGIVSVGPRNDSGNLTCDYTTYSVYTSVPRFVDWLRVEINTLETEIK